MKVLIWILGYLVMTLIYILTASTPLAKAGGIFATVEAILFLAIWIFASRKLCQLWDKRKSAKAKEQAVKAISDLGMTTSEYIKANVPESYLKTCEFYRGKPFELEPYLKTLLKDKRITKDVYEILWDEYK